MTDVKEIIQNISAITGRSEATVAQIVITFQELDNTTINEIFTLILQSSDEELEEWLLRHGVKRQQQPLNLFGTASQQTSKINETTPKVNERSPSVGRGLFGTPQQSSIFGNTSTTTPSSFASPFTPNYNRDKNLNNLFFNNDNDEEDEDGGDEEDQEEEDDEAEVEEEEEEEINDDDEENLFKLISNFQIGSNYNGDNDNDNDKDENGDNNGNDNDGLPENFQYVEYYFDDPEPEPEPESELGGDVEEEVEKEREYECPICTDSFIISDMYTVSCNESHRFCYHCIKHQVTLKLIDKRGINCPGITSLCSYILTPIDLRDIGIDADKVEQYDDSLTKQFLQSTAIACPGRDCEGFIFPSGDFDREKYHCLECDFISCTKCKREYHYRTECDQITEIEERWRSWCKTDRQAHFQLVKNNPNVELKFNPFEKFLRCACCKKQINGVKFSCLNCESFDICEECDRNGLGEHDNHIFIIIGDVQVKKVIEIHQSKQFIAKTTKPCPKCNSSIERDGGCRHITCFICKHEFFWCCLRSFRVEEEARLHRKLCADE